MNRTVSFGDLLTATFAEVSDNRTIVAIYLAIAIPLDAVAFLFGDTQGVNLFGVPVDVEMPLADVGGGFGAALVGLAVAVIGVLLTYWFYAALLERQPAPRFRRFWAFILVYVLSIIGIGLASLAFLVPGIIVAVRWVPLIPVLLAGEEPLMDSFGESWRLTSGSSWAIFGVAIVLIAVGLFVSFLGDFGIALSGGAASVAAALFNAAGDNIAAMLFIAFPVATFRSLADESGEVAAVFE